MINIDAREYDWPKRTADRITDLQAKTTRTDLGGPGSGNFGHAGRPGEVGGSAPDGEGGDDDVEADLDRMEARRTLTDAERPNPEEATELVGLFEAHVEEVTQAPVDRRAGGFVAASYTEGVRLTIKKAIAADLTESLVDHPAFKGQTETQVSAFVREKMELWADTSGDHNPQAVRMQEAVRDEFSEFGLKTDAETAHLYQTSAMRYSKAMSSPAEMAKGRALVRAEYERTQAWFKDHGITHVTLARGMGTENDDLEPGTVTTVKMQPASSWSANVQTSAAFATGAFGRPVVLVARIPVADILSTSVTGRGALSEEEVIVLGRQRKVSVLDGKSERRRAADVVDRFKALRADREPVNIDAVVSNADWIKQAKRPEPKPKAEGVQPVEVFDQLVDGLLKKDLRADQSGGAPTSINLPDIADVSFPEIVGAIAPTVPKRKKRKRAVYKGISLSRRPMKFEAQVLSLTEIPKRLDLARDGLVLHADDDALLQETMQDIASYGAREVLVELTRQGAPAQLVDRPVTVDVDGIYAGLLADRARALTLLREDYDARLGRRRIGAERKAALSREFTDVRRPSLLKRFANRAVNEAFAFGRAQAIQALRRSRMPTEYELAYRDESGRFISTVEAIAGGEAIVDAVIQTAVMDTGTCDECAEVDGEQMELGSDRQEELRPPYVKCAGGDHCRCVQIAILADGTEVDVSDVDEDTIE